MSPPREEDEEAKTPRNGKRDTGKERARRERREDGATDKRTRGAADGVRSRGRRRREGLCRQESQLCGDGQMGNPVLKNCRK